MGGWGHVDGLGPRSNSSPHSRHLGPSPKTAFFDGLLALGEVFDQLRACHRRAPFLFFNGNTFATIGRELSFALFSDLVPGRKREVGSAVAHYIAGVLDRQAMVDAVETLCQSAILQPGNRVKTLRGTMHGTIVRILEDGRVVWRADSGAELTALPESLIPEQNG